MFIFIIDFRKLTWSGPISYFLSVYICQISWLSNSESLAPYLVSSWWARLGCWSLNLKMCRHGRAGDWRLRPWGCRGLKPGVLSVMVGFRSRNRLWTRRPSMFLWSRGQPSLRCKSGHFCHGHLARKPGSPWWQSLWFTVTALLFLLHLLLGLVRAAVIQRGFPLLSDAGEYFLPVVPWSASLPFQRYLVNGWKVPESKGKTIPTCTHFS